MILLPPRGPGLAKTKTPPLLLRREVVFVAASDARWSALLEHADVVSEGAPFGVDPERAYFGTTNIVLLVAPEREGDSLETIAAVAARDPHLRLRAMRAARREASQRAHGPLDSVRAEITVAPCARGVCVHVEVEARVLPDRRSQPRPTPLTPDRAHANS